MHNYSYSSKFYDPVLFQCPGNLKALLPPNCKDLAVLESNLSKLVISSNTKSTWNKHSSAWKSYENFCSSQNLRAWPASIQNLRAYSVSALSCKSLKSDTVKSYLGSIARFHELNNWPTIEAFKDPIVKLILKGATNVSPRPNMPRKIAMSPPLLALLGHKIQSANMSVYEKQLVWSASLCCFFTSCRMGELLSNCKMDAYSHFALRWENVHYMSDGGCVIFLPYTKTKGVAGEFTDLFPIRDSNYCPVAALNRLKSLQKDLNMFGNKKVIFAYPDGSVLTKIRMNKLLETLMLEFCDWSKQKITCKSFRSAIPSLLDAKLESNSHVKLWGRWESGSFERYTKFTRDKKLLVFSNLCAHDSFKPLTNKL